MNFNYKIKTPCPTATNIGVSHTPMLQITPHSGRTTPDISFEHFDIYYNTDKIVVELYVTRTGGLFNYFNDIIEDEVTIEQTLEIMSSEINICVDTIRYWYQHVITAWIDDSVYTVHFESVDITFRCASVRNLDILLLTPHSALFKKKNKYQKRLLADKRSHHVPIRLDTIVEDDHVLTDSTIDDVVSNAIKQYTFDTGKKPRPCDFTAVYALIPHGSCLIPHADNVSINKDNFKKLGDQISVICKTLDIFYVSRIESLCAVLYLLYTLEDYYSVTCALVLYIKTLLSENTSISSVFCDICREVVGNIYNTTNLQVHSGGKFNLMNTFNFCRTHPIIANTMKLATLLVTVGFVSPTLISIKGYKLFEVTAAKEDQTAVDLVESVLNTLNFYCDIGYECFIAKSLKPLLYCSDRISKFEDAYAHCVSYISEVTLGNYFDVTGKDLEHYQTTLLYATSEADALYRLSRYSQERALLLQRRTKLVSVTSLFEAHLKGAGLRKAPFCYKLYGTSSVGKSSVNLIIMKALLLSMGLDAKDEHICTLQDDDKFYSTYHADTQGVIMDDMCNTVFTKADVNPASRVIQIVNNTVSYAPQAEADKKGKIIIKPRVVGITTNNKNLDAELWSCEPVSVLRRCHVHITVRVRPEFACGGKLDSSKVREKYGDTCDTGIHDVWLFDVDELQSIASRHGGADSPVFQPLLVNISIFRLLEYIYGVSEKHTTDQISLVDNYTNLEKHFVKQQCGTCLRLKECCKCTSKSLVVHSGLDIETWFVNYCVRKISNLTQRVLYNVKSFFQLSYWDRTTLYMLDSTELLSHRTNLVSSPWLIWYNWCPDELTKYPLFSHIFHFVERRRMVKNITRILQWSFIPTLIGSISLNRYRTKNTFASNIYTFTCLYGTLCATSRYYMLKRIDSVFNEKHGNYLRLMESLAPQSSKEDLSNRSKIVVGLSALGVGVAALRILWRVYNSVEFKSQLAHSALDPVNGDEISLRDTKVNVWAKDNVERNVNLKTLNMTAEQLVLKLSKSCVHVICQTSLRHSSAIFITTNVLLMPYHNWFVDLNIGNPHHKRPTFIISRGTSPSDSWSDVLDFEMVTRIGTYDLCLVYVPTGGTRLNIAEFFPTTRTTKEVQYLSVRRNREGEIVYGNGSYVPYIVKYDFKHPASYNGGKTFHNVENKPGDCCNALISSTMSPTIIGFHLLGYGQGGSSEGRCGSPLRQEILKALEDLTMKRSCMLLPSSGVCIPEHVCGKTIGYTDLISPYSPVNFLQDSHLRVKGSCDGGATYRGSNIRPSFIVPYMEEIFGFKNCFRGPIFVPNKTLSNPKGEPWRPWYETLSHMANPRKSLPYDSLLYAMQDYEKPLLLKMNESEYVLQYVKPLSNIQIISGIDGIRFIDGMNMSTSMGFPLTGKKSQYFHEVSSADNSCARDFNDPTFWTYFDVACDNYRLGKSNDFIYKACLKDEPMLITKDKVRVFEAAPIILQMILRKYYLPIVRILSIFPTISECAVGVNALGDEWDELHKHVTYFGEDRILAGDYSKWDVRLPAHLMIAAFDVLINLAIASGGYSDDDIVVMRAVVVDVCYPNIAYNGTLIQLYGTNPSGQNLTAYINSICNSLLLRISFNNICGTLSFRDNVKLMTYGDDVIGSVSASCNGYNHNTVAHNLLVNYDVIFTMPDKKERISSDIPNYMNICDVDFLKRKSVYNERLDVYMGALDMTSIYQSLYTTDCKKGDERTIIAQIIEGQLTEIFLHGQIPFEDFRCKMLQVCKKANLHIRSLHLTYEQRAIKWLEKYRGIIPEVHNDSVLGYHDAIKGDTLIVHTGMHCTFLHDGEPSKIDIFLGKKYIEIKLPTINYYINSECLLKTQVDGVDFKKHRGGYPQLRPHSGEGKRVTTEQSDMPLVHFEDTKNPCIDLTPVRDETFYTSARADASLVAFLARPLRIRTLKITTNSIATLANIDLMVALLSHPTVVNRTNNYSYITGTICCKASVSASPYSYGNSIMSAEYYPNMDDSRFNLRGAPALHKLSQFPNVILDYSTSTGGTLKLPIVTPFNMFNLADPNEMVRINVTPLTPARTAGVGTPDVNITIYVWMEDVVLSMPTSRPVLNLVPQSGTLDPPYDYSSELPFPWAAYWIWYESNNNDVFRYSYPSTSVLLPQSGTEYNDAGPISKPASIVAQIAGKLKDAPIIGKYALASQMVARGIADVASIYGFSRPTDVADKIMNIPRPFGNFSNFNVTDTCSKLSMDCKQEVTVDPGVTGLDFGDEMNIANIAQKEMWITNFLWTPVTSVDFALFRSVVTPCLVPFAQVTDYTIPLTPAAHMALPFKYWKGGMKFRFQVVCTPFHQGKLRVVYDPSNLMLNQGQWITRPNITYSWVLDIAESRSFEICVAWGSAHPYLYTEGICSKIFYDATVAQTETIPFLPARHNGMIGVHPLEPLSCGSNTVAVVEVNVFTSMCEDVQFAVPTGAHIRDLKIGNNDLGPQSGMVMEDPSLQETMQMEMEVNNGTTFQGGDNIPAIHFGERIVSIRQVLKRYVQHAAIASQDYVAFPGGLDIPFDGTGFFRKNINMPVFPLYAQFEANSLSFSRAYPPSAVLSTPYNKVNMTYLNWYTPAFLARRGGIRWKFYARAFGDYRAMLGVSNSYVSGTLVTGKVFPDTANVDPNQVSGYIIDDFDHRQGAEITDTHLNSMVEVEIPYATAKRFYFAQNRNLNLPRDETNISSYYRDHQFMNVHILSKIDNTTGAHLRSYCAAADDYQLIHYKSAPYVWCRLLPPVPGA